MRETRQETSVCASDNINLFVYIYIHTWKRRKMREEIEAEVYTLVSIAIIPLTSNLRL
jgi:hypothetical protein